MQPRVECPSLAIPIFSTRVALTSPTLVVSITTCDIVGVCFKLKTMMTKNSGVCSIVVVSFDTTMVMRIFIDSSQVKLKLDVVAHLNKISASFRETVTVA